MDVLAARAGAPSVVEHPRLVWTLLLLFCVGFWLTIGLLVLAAHR